MAGSQTPYTQIDGSKLEGGGQILRNAVSLSSLMQKPVSIDKIRFNRNPPGLKNQHRTGLELASQITSGSLVGASNGSSFIQYAPGRISSGNFTADCVTAGSVTLLLQIALPLLLFSSQSEFELSQDYHSSEPSPEGADSAVDSIWPDSADRADVKTAGTEGYRVGAVRTPSTLRLLGGTNASQAPQIEYTEHVFLSFLHRHFLPSKSSGNLNLSFRRDPGVELDCRVRGYYPKGGGEVVASVFPLLHGEKLRPVSLLKRGKIKAIRGVAHYAKLPTVIGKDMRRSAERVLAEAGYHIQNFSQSDDEEGVLVDILEDRESNEVAVAGGSGIVLWAELEGGGFIGGSAVGRKGRSATDVGAEAAKELLRGLTRGGCVDEWLQDQIVIFMALAEGRSEVNCGKGELELHTETAIWVAEQMTDARFDVSVDEAGNTVLSCTGIGHTTPLPTPTTTP